VASIPACHAGDRGSIPRRGVKPFLMMILFDSRWRNRIEIDVADGVGGTCLYAGLNLDDDWIVGKFQFIILMISHY
jgi:hypothetical protein